MDLPWNPYAEFGFMQRALLGCLLLSVSAPLVGVFLLLRRMSLTGDAMAHAILPGAALGYLVSGLSLGAMTVGGLVAGLAVVLLSGLVARSTVLREDASLAAFYLLSLAAGVLIISSQGRNVDLLRVLFGSVLALDDPTLALLGLVAILTAASTGAGMRGSGLPALGQPAQPVGTLRFSGAAGAEPRGRFPCPGHAAVGRHDDPAGRRGAAVGAAAADAADAGGRAVRRRQQCRAGAVVPP
jgi:zinc/manganese transport system permease protein